MRALTIPLSLILLVPASTAAQQQSPASDPEPQREAQLPEKPEPVGDARRVSPAQDMPQPHRFWDKRNAWLFAGVGAMRALDYHSTRNMRRRGRDEILLSNAVVDNKPLFIAIEAAGTAASIGLAYLFHKTNHHTLERWVSIVHISVGGVSAARNYALQTRRAPPALP